MKYAALLRGINVGGNKRVEMKRLKAMLEKLGYVEVKTYLNSGNAIFESDKKAVDITKGFSDAFKTEFGFDIPTLIISIKQIQKIIKQIPEEWINDDNQKTDVAFLFKNADLPEIIEQLPIKKEFIDIRYTKGALYWNISRENYNKSQLNKIVGHKLYKFMTVRNINTARFLANS
jgi:uncharacterized protein (DUF1697 family)